MSAYLRSNKPNLSVRGFAEDFLDSQTRKEYTRFMRTHGFEQRDYPKDTVLIKTKLRQRRLTFTSKVKITGPAENFSELVQVLEKDGNNTIVKISGDIAEQ